MNKILFASRMVLAKLVGVYVLISEIGQKNKVLAYKTSNFYL